MGEKESRRESDADKERDRGREREGGRKRKRTKYAPEQIVVRASYFTTAKCLLLLLKFSVATLSHNRNNS